MLIPQIIIPNFINALLPYSHMATQEMEKLDVEEFCQEFELIGFHGTIPGLYWHEKSRMCGNLAMYSKNFSSEVSLYIDNKKMLFLDFSNPLLTRQDMYNRFGNEVLKSFNDFPNCTVICASEALYNHVKNEYFRLKTCWKFFIVNSPDEVIEKLKYNDYVLLPTSCGYDIELLKAIPQFLRQRCIISVNDLCDASCPNFERHLKESSEIALMLTQTEESDFCGYFYGEMDEEGNSHKIEPISYSYATDNIIPLDYNHFYIDSLETGNHYIKEACNFAVKDGRKLTAIDIFTAMFLDKLY